MLYCVMFVSIISDIYISLNATTTQPRHSHERPSKETNFLLCWFVVVLLVKASKQYGPSSIILALGL